MSRTIFAGLFPLFLMTTCLHGPETDQVRNSGDHKTNRQPVHRLVGGPCEGCEAVFEYGNKKLGNVDTLPDFSDEGLRIKVYGIVYKPGGITPAGNVILYIYHANQEGIYPKRGNEKGWGKRHGYIRGWVKTGKHGEYAFYTLKPGAYPSRDTPAHIHITILEPDGKYYWLNSYHFEGDSLLKHEDISTGHPRGGSNGLLSLYKDGKILSGKRDIVLGKNIPGYD